MDSLSNTKYYQSTNKNNQNKTILKCDSLKEKNEIDFNSLQNPTTSFSFTRNDVSSPSSQHSKEDIKSHNSSISTNFNKQVYSSILLLQFAKKYNVQTQKNALSFKKKLYLLFYTINAK